MSNPENIFSVNFNLVFISKVKENKIIPLIPRILPMLRIEVEKLEKSKEEENAR